MRIAIVDDLKEDIRVITETLLQFYEEQNRPAPEISTFYSGEEFLADFSNNKWDFIFLDIFMDGITGIETARRIRQVDTQVHLLFLTTSNDFASESYEVEADGYLLKPYTRVQIERFLDRMLPVIQNQSRIISLPDGTTANTNGLLYSEYSGHYAYLHMKKARGMKVRINQSQLEELLTPMHSFFVCNKGIIVNFDYVENISDKDLILKDGTHLPISRRRLQEVKQAYAEYVLNHM